MGLFLPLDPPATRKGRWAWRVGFTIIGTISALAGLYEFRSTDRLQRNILSSITGSQGFCYVGFLANRGEDVTSPVKLTILNPSAYPQREVRIRIRRIIAADASINEIRDNMGHFYEQYVGTVMPGASVLDVSVLPGNYAIDISSLNGGLFEHLFMESLNGTLAATINVYRQFTDQKVFSSNWQGDYNGVTVRLPRANQQVAPP
jgi:hypothetical protein